MLYLLVCVTVVESIIVFSNEMGFEVCPALYFIKDFSIEHKVSSQLNEIYSQHVL